MALPKTASALDFTITTTPTKTYALDFDNERIVGKVDGLTAMVQAVRKALTTARYTERIYSGDYGSELETLIGQSLSYVKAKARALLEEALSADERVKGVRHIEIEQSETDTAVIKATIATEYGEIYVDQTIRG